MLGRGRFGAVHRALNVNTGEVLAVKQVQVESKTGKRMLQREISLMRSMSLRSPNVVRCVATELADDTFHIFMEYVSGGSLKSVIKEYGKLPTSTVMSYTKQILTGLKTLHDAGIAHRDIKADNLLLSDSGVIKLADFGSAKRISTQRTMHTTAAGAGIKGSPLWMAPEVIRNEVTSEGDPLTSIRRWKRADVWSLGCTIIEMATGEPPFNFFSNPTAAMYHIATCKEPPEFPETIGDTGRDMLGRALTIEGDQRPSVDVLLLHPFVNL